MGLAQNLEPFDSSSKDYALKSNARGGGIYEDHSSISSFQNEVIEILQTSKKNLNQASDLSPSSLSILRRKTFKSSARL